MGDAGLCSTVDRLQVTRPEAAITDHLGSGGLAHRGPGRRHGACRRERQRHLLHPASDGRPAPIRHEARPRV